jgi:glycosyltransferase involved in cell wall biosynthesis
LGVRFATVLHDPVRDYIVGPGWWHRWSVREAASFVDWTFAHGEVGFPFASRPVWLPHGTYGLPDAGKSRSHLRAELGIPQRARVLLSYGFVRDNKNLDLVLRAIARCPDLWLVIAGAEQAGGNRPIAFYQALAQELGCADRCRWITRFLDPSETANVFGMTDLNLLTYSRSFVSASGVLATAAYYRVPSLVSGGLAATQRLVEDYHVGIWLEPDDESAIVSAVDRWRRGLLSPQWDRYQRDHSWQKNAELVSTVVNGSLAGQTAT